MCPLCGSALRHQHPSDPKMMVCSDRDCGGCGCDECWNAVKKEELSPEENEEFYRKKLTRMASYPKIKVNR